MLLAIGDDPSGDVVCLSIGEDTGVVYLWDHETAELDDAYRSLGVDFDAFLDSLDWPEEHS